MSGAARLSAAGLALLAGLAPLAARAETLRPSNRWGLPAPDVKIQQMPDLSPRAQFPDLRQPAPRPVLVVPPDTVAFVNRTRDRVTIYVRIARETPLTLEPGATALIECREKCDEASALVLTAAPGRAIEQRVALKSGARFAVTASEGVYVFARE
jgi:hypothetical protein